MFFIKKIEWNRHNDNHLLQKELVSKMNIFGNAKGVTIPANKTIYLNPKNTPTEKINNLIHELGHVQLHTNTNQLKTSLLIEELQANLISYFIVIVKNYGIDNHD